MFKRLVGSALLFGMAAAAPPAFAQGCADRETLVERLQSKYSEVRTAGGLHGSASNTQSAALVEVWSSEKTGTFTVILTNAQGVSCVVAAGTDWFQHVPMPEPPGVNG
ncbi:hypothetical protein J7399_07735 [Shimia sp. R9_1]|uniref:hypothetical protein n=1 Tax=unclassified Shimia TaxID=2630038 RepID=UPI001ADC36C3|nr:MULTISPECIES: hypothetical protein [unclassified Shimia]MBO9395308.1 hypothetical protein [Shimia sp. R9_2]MBO9399472.1 hypothetical protein [Shimia sp. R9_3]MBO9407313.1 hypothetical protein [Shimia sp. R9_1]